MALAEKKCTRPSDAKHPAGSWRRAGRDDGGPFLGSFVPARGSPGAPRRHGLSTPGQNLSRDRPSRHSFSPTAESS
eukprot:127195-Pyramimonas_sp.AAC.1